MRISMPVFFVDGGTPGNGTAKGWFHEFEIKEVDAEAAPVVATWRLSDHLHSYRACEGRLWSVRTENGRRIQAYDLHRDDRDSIENAYSQEALRNLFLSHPLADRGNGVVRVDTTPLAVDDPRFAQAVAEMQVRLDANMVVDGAIWEHSTGPLLVASTVRGRSMIENSSKIIDLLFMIHRPIRPTEHPDSLITLATTSHNSAIRMSAFEHEAAVAAFGGVFSKVRIKGEQPTILSTEGWSMAETRDHVAAEGMRSMIAQSLYLLRSAPLGECGRGVVAAWRKAADVDAFHAAGLDELHGMATDVVEQPIEWSGASKTLWRGVLAAHAAMRPGPEALETFSLPAP